MRHALLGLLAAFTLAPLANAAEAPPSIPAVDAPELARLGPETVGVQSLTLTQYDQADVLHPDPASHALPLVDRVLPVDVWYPALPTPGAAPASYTGALTGEDGKDVAFTTPGLALRDAAPRPGPYPIVILAHGMGGTPAAMTWLSENLASKGYIVMAPHFEDPPYGDVADYVWPLARRPLDMAFLAKQARQLTHDRAGPFAGADSSRIALIGYSMGGYGVLTAAGGALDPALGPATRGVLAPYVKGGPHADALEVANLKAVIAISPAGRFGGALAWGRDGLSAITAPTLFIAGDADHTVGFDPGVKSLYEAEKHAPRWLLVFENGGHSIGMNPAPETMRGRLWDQDWFEDPVWAKRRVIGVQLHFITAFLDRYVKGDLSDDAYLNVAQPRAADGVWPQGAGPAGYSALSPGVAPITVWKGFARGHAAGLELRRTIPKS